MRRIGLHRFAQIMLVFLLSMALVSACSDDTGGLPDIDAGGETDIDAGTDDADREDVPGPAPDADTGDADRPDEDSGGEWDWDDDEDFGIHAVHPARGPVDGGTTVHVSGGELNEDTALLFGGHLVDSELSQGQLVADTPPASTPGPVTVRAVHPDGDVSEIPNGFTYADPIEVDDVTPDIVPTTGGFEITLQGSGFAEPMGVSFDSTPARSIDVVNSQTVRVVVPEMPRGSTDIRVTATDAGAELDDAVHFFDPVDIDLIEPAAGDIGGGTPVTIEASGITWESAVRFGDQYADIDSVDIGAQTMTVTTPPASETGPVDVVVESPYDTDRTTDGFVYDDGDDPALYSVQPAVADVSGGTEHVVSGRGFDQTGAQLRVGDSQAPIVDTGPSHARIEAPAVSEPKIADVALDVAGDEQDRLDDALEYRHPLTIDDITPAAGSTDGQESVSIHGSGFHGVEGVSFGGRSASFEIIDDDHLEVTTPDGESGYVDVAVADDRRKTTVEDGFLYEAELQIWSMTPSRGALAGNTFVTLRGAGFSGEIGVDVGDESAGDIRRLDPYTVTFRTPSGSSTGAHEVSVTADDRQAQPPYPFVYFEPLSSFGGAWGNPINGAVNVSVLAIDGSPVPNAFVMLSFDPDTPYRGYTDQRGQITLSGPDVLGPQTITATAAGLSTFTVRELNAQNVTLILHPTEPADGDGNINIEPPPEATFEGTVTITGKGSDPEGGIPEYNMSKVRTTQSAVGGTDLLPGADSVVDGEGSYELRSRVGDVALVALCGRYDEEADHFTPKMMAVERYLTVADGQVEQIDLECDIPLEESIPIHFHDPVYAPDGPTANRVQPYLDFGFEGVLPMPEAVTGLDDILHAEPLPAPEDELEDIQFAATVGSYTDGSLPYTTTTVEDINSVGEIQSTRPLVGVPKLVEPSQGTAVDGPIRLGLEGVNQPDFYHILLRNSHGLPAWRFLAPGHHDFIPLPEFPSFSELPADQRPNPYQSGSMFTSLYAAEIDNFDYHGFTFGDLQTSSWDAYGIEATTMMLAE